MSGDAATESDREHDAETESLLAALNPVDLPLRQQLGLIGLGLLLLVPVGFDPIYLLQFTSALYFGMFAMSWDAVSGYTGQISFGHGLFFAVGGYTSALLNLGYGLDPLVTIPVGMVLAAVAGVLIGVPALRLRGPYLSLVTLVAPLILLQIFIVYSGIFGGELGVGSPENFLGLGLDQAIAVYYVALALFVGILGVLMLVTRSDAGAVFTAIREDEDTVAAAGLNPAKFKIFAFVLSAAIGGLAGAMFVHTPRGNPTPSQLLVTQVNVEVIIAAILGGMGTIVGAAVGGIIVYLLPEYLSGVDLVVPVLNTPIAEIDFLLFAVIALALLFFLPGGLLRAGIRIGRRVLRDRDDADHGGGGDPIADGGRRSTPLERTIERYRSFRRGDSDDDER